MTIKTKAGEDYGNKKALVNKELERIKAQMFAHGLAFEQNGKRDWGYPGDLGRTLAALKEIKLEG